ncbi:hypothetical protein XENTR_v10003315 [Xenopus tropicalis]|nr:hypothetical protein XENTR_v10003315 [Xenopus tropicalis]
MLQYSLKSWTPSHGSVLLQYGNDLPLCSPNQVANVAHMVCFLQHLALEGHKIAKHKTQMGAEFVEY